VINSRNSGSVDVALLLRYRRGASRDFAQMQLKNQGPCDPVGNDRISPPTYPWIVGQHRVSPRYDID